MRKDVDAATHAADGMAAAIRDPGLDAVITYGNLWSANVAVDLHNDTELVCLHTID
jgi:hypothetical protein